MILRPRTAAIKEAVNPSERRSSSVFCCHSLHARRVSHHPSRAGCP